MCVINIIVGIGRMPRVFSWKIELPNEFEIYASFLAIRLWYGAGLCLIDCGTAISVTKFGIPDMLGEPRPDTLADTMSDRLSVWSSGSSSREEATL